MKKLIAPALMISALLTVSPLTYAGEYGNATAEQIRAQAGLLIAAQGNLALKAIIKQHSNINWVPAQHFEQLPRMQLVQTSATPPCTSKKSNSL